MSKNAHETFWTLHVGGPDDLIHFDTLLDAQQHLAGMVDMLKALGYEQQRSGVWLSKHEFDPRITFEIIPPSSSAVVPQGRGK